MSPARAARYASALAEAAAAGWTWPDAAPVAVTDGDTFDCRVTKSFTIDVGFGGATTGSTTYQVRLRLARVNAPSNKKPAGQASQAWLAVHLLSCPQVALATLDAYKFGGPRYSPGEWMAEVTLPDGRDLSDLMVAEGFAVYWDGAGPRPGDG